MGLHATNIKETPRTFTITFDITGENRIEDIKRLKALAILLGYYNPMRKEMIDTGDVYQLVNEIKTIGSLDWDLQRISKLLK